MEPRSETTHINDEPTSRPAEMTEDYINIVVIDDSPASLALYAHAVASLAVNLESFQSGDEGYAYLSQHQVDLIFLSNLIHGADGLELLERIKLLECQADTPVIILSSKDYDQDKQLARDKGGREYLVKPIPATTIREMITKYTGAVLRTA